MLINYSNLYKRQFPFVNITQQLPSTGCAALSGYELCMSAFGTAIWHIRSINYVAASSPVGTRAELLTAACNFRELGPVTLNHNK